MSIFDNLEVQEVPMFELTHKQSVLVHDILVQTRESNEEVLTAQDLKNPQVRQVKREMDQLINQLQEYLNAKV